MNVPTGTVTFLFTDIEGSTKLWEQHPEAMRVALARHDVLLRQAIEDNNGYVFKTVGDAFCAAFATAPDALAAALFAQCALHAETWQDALSLRVRMALHTGNAELRDGDYFGQPLNRVARLLDAGHGGQVLISAVTQELTSDTLPVSVSLRSLGEHRLRDLGRPEPIFQLLHPALPSELPPLKSLDNLSNNLPQQVTSFIGREKEIEAVKTLLGKTRLLTLTGSGGCGKTRLGLQVAAEVLENYPDGAWLVELAPLVNPTLVPQSVASVFGVREEAGKPIVQTLVEFLKAKHLLLVLDNCEHVLDACSRLVDTLIRACPCVRVLASSREGLGIAGELTYRIPSLSLPDPKQAVTVESVSQYEAVQLFIERALFHLPAFAVTSQNAPALASVCHRLDGIPFAIELSAARVRSLSVEEINNKLDNCFRLLTGGSRTALPRQQTLRALIDWSYDMLTPQEKTLLCRLSVFAGGWTLEAAEAIGSGHDIEDWGILDSLTSLTDKSLVVAEQEQGQTRYHLLETIRQYASERLLESGDADVIRQQHQTYFLTMVENAGLLGMEADHALKEAEHGNLRAALEWRANEKALRLVGELWWFWHVRGYLSEGRARLSTILSATENLALAIERANALNGAGILAYTQGDYISSRTLLEESLALHRATENIRGIARLLNNLGNTLCAEGHHTKARILYEESLNLRIRLENKAGIAASLNSLGLIAQEEGNYSEARTLHEQSLALVRELKDKWGMAYTLVNLGQAVCAENDYTTAQTMFKEGLELYEELEDKWGISYSLTGFAELAEGRLQVARAAQLWGAAEALRENIGVGLSPYKLTDQNSKFVKIRLMMGEDAFAAGWAQGRAMTMEQAIEYALEQAAP